MIDTPIAPNMCELVNSSVMKVVTEAAIDVTNRHLLLIALPINMLATGAIRIPISSKMLTLEDGNCDRNCDRNMLNGSTQHKFYFAIKLNPTLCMYMHRSALVYIYIH